MQANPAEAEAMASAGREVAEAMGFDDVCRYMFELLSQVGHPPGFWRR